MALQVQHGLSMKLTAGEYIFVCCLRVVSTYTSPLRNRIALAPPYPGLRRFKQGRNFSQWTGDDSKALMKVYMNAIQAFVPSEVVKTIAAFLEFCYIARRNVITEDSLEQLKAALKRFHEFREVFRGTVRGDGPSAFSLPRQHAMVHYYDHIKNFGSPNGLCSSITESKHIVAVKRPWRRSNKHAALSQMLKTNERLDKISAARVDFTTRGMLTGSCLAQAITDSLDDSAGSNEDSDSETDYENDEIRPFSNVDSPMCDPDHDLHDPDHDLHDPRHDLHDPNHDLLDIDSYLHDIDSYQHDRGNTTPNTPLQIPAGDDDDDECGPVESGPLMNEVRLLGRKGKYISIPL
jgi:hypothetical protein